MPTPRLSSSCGMKSKFSAGTMKCCCSSHLCQRLNRSHVAVVFERRRNPMIELVDHLARRIELKPAMRPRTAERIYEREVSDQPKSFVARRRQSAAAPASADFPRPRAACNRARYCRRTAPATRTSAGFRNGPSCASPSIRNCRWRASRSRNTARSRASAGLRTSPRASRVPGKRPSGFSPTARSRSRSCLNAIRASDDRPALVSVS